MANQIFATQGGTEFAFKEEATFNTAPTDAAVNSLLTRGVVVPKGLGVNWVENQGVLNHLGHMRPYNGGYKDDLGFSCPIDVKGSGTHGAAPAIGDLLECSFGKESLGVAGDCDITPLTTVSFKFATGSAAVGHLCDVALTGGTECRRILTYATGTAGVWPPLSAAPALDDLLYPGVAYLLTSTPSEMKSGTAFWYFKNGAKKYISGCRGNVKLVWQYKQPIVATFDMMGCGQGPEAHQAAIGYTWLPPDLAIDAPMVMGITLNVYIPAKVKTGTTTTSVLLKQTDGTASYWYFTDAAADASNPDKLIVDTDGAGAWNTRSIATWNYTTQTATCTALDALPAEDNNAYIQHRICIPDMISFDPGHTVTRYDCANATYGWDGSQIKSRESVIEWSSYFRSLMPEWMQSQQMFSELWARAGSTRGNIVNMCMPNIFNDSYEIDMGGDLGMYKTTGQAIGTSSGADANTEMYLTFG